MDNLKLYNCGVRPIGLASGTWTLGYNSVSADDLDRALLKTTIQNEVKAGRLRLDSLHPMSTPVPSKKPRTVKVSANNKDRRYSAKEVAPMQAPCLTLMARMDWVLAGKPEQKTEPETVAPAPEKKRPRPRRRTKSSEATIGEATKAE